MRKGQNRKVKNAGRAGCLGLLALGLALANPIGLSAYAEENPENTSEQSDTMVLDDEIDTQAATASTVTISFSPSSASGSVTPIDSTNGDKAKVDVQATVNVKNSGGYSVYVGSSSSQLKNGSNVIDSVTSATTYANLPLNRWGFSFRKANSATDKTVEDSYKAMPATLRSTALDSNTNTSITDETRYYMLSFAARIGSDKPAGTYTNSVTMSVVSSPLEITNKFGINTMQEMTSTVCSGVASGTSDQLKDTRDGKFYWVSKLADGKCWMTQNLDLDLSTATKLTSDTSDVPAAGWTPGFSTATTASSSTVNSGSYTDARSWSLGNYRIANPDNSSSCGSAKSSAANCASQFTAYNTPTSQNGDINAHYILGNHYSWNAATAGTGGSITSGTATNSICPKGWRLPTSNTGGELPALVTALGGTSSTNNITKAPFYGVRGGYIHQLTSYLFYGAGDNGDYWSSTPSSSTNNAYYLKFEGTSTVNPSYSEYRNIGRSVRCIAR